MEREFNRRYCRTTAGPEPQPEVVVAMRLIYQLCVKKTLGRLLHGIEFPIK